MLQTRSLPPMDHPSGGVIVGLSLAAVALVMVAGAVGAEGWETLESRRAADLLPAEILAGDHYRIGDAVETDGFLNFYDLQTDFGPFSADSDWELEIRLLEVEAMAEMGKTSQSKAVAKAVGSAALAPVDTAADLVTDPVGTAKSVGRGVGRLFKSTKRVAAKVTEKKEEPEEPSDGAEQEVEGKEQKPSDEPSTGAKLLGSDKQVRLWAYRLRIDPYTDNPVVEQELNRVAKASAAGGASFNLRAFDREDGGLPNVNKDLYILSFADLRLRNEQILVEAGFTAESFEAFVPFFTSPYLSPTLQTIILDKFLELDGVEGREGLVEMAAAMQSVDEARFQVGHAEFLAAYHQGVNKLKTILGGEIMPAAITREGETILVLAADHVSWTEDLATAAQTRLEELKAVTDDETIDLYVAGDATERAIQGLASLGARVLSVDL